MNSLEGVSLVEPCTLDQARVIIEWLSSSFDCDKPLLVVKRHLPYGQGGYYQQGTIFLSEQSLKPWVVLHEFAHHLVALRRQRMQRLRDLRASVRSLSRHLREWKFGYSLRYAPMRRTKAARHRQKRKEHHGGDFVSALWRVIKVAQVVDRYPVEREYKRVASKIRALRGF